MSLFRGANGIVAGHLRVFEMIGVVMRIISFTLVSWMGPESPFLFVWTFNTADAALLTWCAALKRDPAYILLNTFWILVGLLGMARAAGYLS